MLVALTGPMPMMAGSTPTTPEATTRAIGSSPSRSQAALEATSSAAAPSLRLEALPAVTVPPLRNTGRSEASASMLVSARGPSSRSNIFVCLRPAGTSRGTSSSANSPASQLATASWDAGEFADELVPLEVPAGRKQTKMFDRDEGPRADTSMEALASLRPVFRKGGTVTAGNASSLNDGAAALLVASKAACERLGLEPIARVVASGVVGVDPAIMGIGPVNATNIAVRRAGWDVESIDTVELNEAFAGQSLAVLRELPLDPESVNPQGGAIAINDGLPELVVGDCDPLDGVDSDVCAISRTIDGRLFVVSLENPAVLQAGTRLDVSDPACGSPQACDAVTDVAIVDVQFDTDPRVRATGGTLELDAVEEFQRYAGSLRLQLPDGGRLNGFVDLVPRPD